MEVLHYYASHGVITDPRGFASLFSAAPADPFELVHWSRNVNFHEVYAAEAALELPAGAADTPGGSDAAVRRVDLMLERIAARDSRPLAEARDKDKCFIGTCRDYATLLCSLFRSKGIPARVRCGFAFYFSPEKNFGDDHWVTEYWNASEKRWIIADAEIDSALPQHAPVIVNPIDIPRAQFQTAGTAWKLVQSGKADSEQYGVEVVGITGKWFMAANVLRDLAALNKFEMAPFDYWGLSAELVETESISQDQEAVIDTIAAVIADDAFNFEAAQRMYLEMPQIRVSDPVIGWPKGQRTEFRLRLEERA